MPKSHTYVVLLRGINVGGRTTVPMAELREVCETAGCTDVTTYIQSGNIVLSSTLSADRLRSTLHDAIAQRFPLAPDVMVRTSAEMASVLEQTPYPDVDHVHVLFLPDAPEHPAALESLGAGSERLAVRGREIYFHLPNGVGRAKLPIELGRRLTQPGTMRNWRTVTKLVELSR
jgi:uncharacterized protein (DUF1697 family)